MKLEFYDKKTGEVVKYQKWYVADGSVFTGPGDAEITHWLEIPAAARGEPHE
jgi:hypothetical protein